MKIKLILIATFILASALYGDPQAGQKNGKELGVPMAIVTNNTEHDLKFTLQFKNQTSEQEMIENSIPAETKKDKAIKFTKGGSLTGYKGAKFIVRNVINRMGIHADDWTGELQGENEILSHTFEYRAVVQNPIKIMSIVKLKMIVKYEDDVINVSFSAPDQDSQN